jgi:DNA-binding HxlR family transcriptional regulator
MSKRLAKSFNCSTEFTLQVLGGKWKTVIMCHLTVGPLRYAELRRLIPTLSDKILTQRLREMVEAGLISRKKSGNGDTETYALAATGRSLSGVLTGLYRWGEDHAAAFGVTVGHPLLDTGRKPKKDGEGPRA